MKYIDVELLCETLNAYKSNVCYCLGDDNIVGSIVDNLIKMISNFPTADVLPFEKLGDNLMVEVGDLKEFNRVILSQGTWCRTFYEGEE